MAEFTAKVAATPLNLTSVAPVKLVPVIVTLVPIGPLVGVKEVILGATAGRLNVTVLSMLTEAAFVRPEIVPVATPAGIVTVTVPDAVMPLTATL